MVSCEFIQKKTFIRKSNTQFNIPYSDVNQAHMTTTHDGSPVQQTSWQWNRRRVEGGKMPGKGGSGKFHIGWQILKALKGRNVRCSKECSKGKNVCIWHFHLLTHCQDACCIGTAIDGGLVSLSYIWVSVWMYEFLFLIKDMSENLLCECDCLHYVPAYGSEIVFMVTSCY